MFLLSWNRFFFFFFYLKSMRLAVEIFWVHLHVFIYRGTVYTATSIKLCSGETSVIGNLGLDGDLNKQKTP